MAKKTRAPERLLPADTVKPSPALLAGAVAAVIAVIYAYWPTLVWIEDAWRNEPDYSHGYLVLRWPDFSAGAAATSFRGFGLD